MIRQNLVIAGAALLCLLIFGRMIWFKETEHDRLSQHSSRSLNVERVISAPRGKILDAKGRVLAISSPVLTFSADPKRMRQNHPIISKLARDLKIPEAQIREKLAQKQKHFVYLKRNIPPSEIAHLSDYRVHGLSVERGYRRFYPEGSAIAQIIGVTDVDQQGISGLEKVYEAQLAGKDGVETFQRDRYNRRLSEVIVETSTEPGLDIQTTLDIDIQRVMYRALKRGVHAHKANSGTAVVLNAKTGAILAMGSYPSFNPNDAIKGNQAYRRNRAVTDLFEPGSTIKPFTVLSALEYGPYHVKSRFDTNPGYMPVGRKLIKDHRNYGELDFYGVIARSSNVATTQMSQALGAGVIQDVWQRLGVGYPIGLDFPGERAGTLNLKKRLSKIELANLSFGYGMSMTAIQLARAYTVFSAQGVMLDPFLTPDKKIKTSRVQVFSPEYVESVKEFLEATTLKEGTGTLARVHGFRVAGKTGTVHKVSAQGYAKKKYQSLFAGLAPLDDPDVIVVVMVDEPSAGDYYGGKVAAPIFSEIVRQALHYRGVLPRR